MSVNLNDLSIEELKKIKKEEKEEFKKDYLEYKKKEEQKKKQKLIADIKNNRKTRVKFKLNPKIINNNKPKPKPKPKPTKAKTYEDYFQECIKNRTIPPDTPSYLREALERALKEYDQGIEKEKTALEGFANKYILKGETGITPSEFFKSKSTYLKDFLRNHRHIKIRFVLVCLMEKMVSDESLKLTDQIKAYFHSDTLINLESTDVKEILIKVIRLILQNISIFQKNGSGWYFKEIVNLEIHTVEYKPMRGSYYIPLPDWIMRKKAIVNIRNNDGKCFLWCVLRYLHPRDKNDPRIADLKKYEKSLKTKGIRYPVKLQDISKFEKLNPDLPGINVFSVNENNKFYPLRMAEKNPQETIHLFLYEEDGKYHYSLIKSFSRLFRSQITSRTNGKIYICKGVLLISRKRNYSKNIFYIVQVMKQLL